MRVLVDTNILISAALNSNGTPYKAHLKDLTDYRLKWAAGKQLCLTYP